MKNNIINTIKHDFGFKTKRDLLMIGLFFINAVFIFVGLFWVPALYIALVYSIALLFFLKKNAKIYLYLFLFPFYHIFRLNAETEGMILYLIIIGVFIFAVEYLIDLIKKIKRINYKVLIPLALITIYVMLPIGPYELKDILRVVGSILLFYLCFEYKNLINLKSMTLAFVFGLVLSCAMEPCRAFSLKLEEFLPNIASGIGESLRFCGLMSDPNFFGLDVIIVLSLLVHLFLTRQIKIIFYPLLILFSCVGFLTLSKAYLLVYSLLMAILIIVQIMQCLRSKKDKNNWYKLIATVFSLIMSVLICLPLIKFIIFRFGSISNTEFNIGLLSLAPATFLANGHSGGDIFNQITTGRSDIWSVYLGEIFSSVSSSLFGSGLSAPILWVGSVEANTHNFYVEALYRLGIVGCAIVIGVILLFFIKTGTRGNRRFINFIPTICMCVMLFSLDCLFSYRVIYLILFGAYSLNYNGNVNQNSETSDMHNLN